MANKDENEKATSEGASLLSVIPTLYYDLIARICPGFAFILALALHPWEFDKLPKLEFSVTLGLFVAVVLSYLVGIVLTGFSVPWDALTLRVLSIDKRLRAPLGLRSQSLVEQWYDVSEKMERIAMRSSQAGQIVTKALAEVALCENLLTGIVCLAVIGEMTGGDRFFQITKEYLAFGSGFLLVFISMLFRQAMFLGRVEALYKLHEASRGRVGGK